MSGSTAVIPPGSPVGGAAVPPPVAAPPTTVTIGSSSDFSAAVLAVLVAMGAIPASAVTQADIGSLNAWTAAETNWHSVGQWNPQSYHNPLNLEGATKGYPQTRTGVQYATPTNPINVYATWGDGIVATAQRISANPGITRVLATGQASPSMLSAAVTQSGWGTGSFGGASTASIPVSGSPQTATLTGISLGNLPADIGAAAGSVIPGLGLLPDVASALPSSFGVLGDLTSPSFWKRIAMGVGGVALMIGGVVIFLASTKPGQEAVSMAPAALVAAAA